MKKLNPYLISLFFTFFCYTIHTLDSSNSMLSDITNIENGPLVRAFKLHKSHAAFVKRPFTVLLIEKVKSLTNLEIAEAFILISFLFYFINGILIYYLSKRFTQNHTIIYINMVVYFVCFSNIFSFFVPIYTYDEPIQFCFLLLSLIMFYKEKWILFIMLFSVSIIARESALLLLPGLFLIILNNKFSPKKILEKEFLLKSLIISTPVFIYFIYVIIFVNYNGIAESSKNDFMSRLWHLKFNFQSMRYTIETITSFFLVLGLPIYLLYNSFSKKEILRKHKLYINAFKITIIINSFIVMSTTIARESRLFIIPLFFLWPIFGILFHKDFIALTNSKNLLKVLKNWKYFLLFNILNFIISFKVYYPTVGSVGNFYREYLFLYILIIITHAQIKYYSKKNIV